MALLETGYRRLSTGERSVTSSPFRGVPIGRFYGSDTLDGRAILVRFVITPKSATVALFEQAFSADGGATWETNWIANDTRR